MVHLEAGNIDGVDVGEAQAEGDEEEHLGRRWWGGSRWGGAKVRRREVRSWGGEEVSLIAKQCKRGEE